MQTDRKYSIEKGVVGAEIFSGSYTTCRGLSWEPLGSSFESLPASFLKCVCCTSFRKPLCCSCRSTWRVPWQPRRVAVGKAGRSEALLSLGQRLAFKLYHRQLQSLPAALHTTASSHSQQAPQPFPAVCHKCQQLASHLPSPC